MSVNNSWFFAEGISFFLLIFFYKRKSWYFENRNSDLFYIINIFLKNLKRNVEKLIADFTNFELLYTWFITYKLFSVVKND